MFESNDPDDDFLETLEETMNDDGLDDWIEETYGDVDNNI